MDGLVNALSALKDVRGVEGSFYATRDGRIVARDLPRIFDGDPLDGVATRLGRVLEAMQDLGGHHDGTLVRYPNHAMLIRPTEDGMLCVLTTADVNIPSLKRGASLVARRIPALPPLPSLRDSGTTLVPMQFTPAQIAAAQGTATQAVAPAQLAPPPPPRAPMPALPPPTPPPRPALAAPRVAAPAMRASTPGAPASPAMRWRGSSVKDG